MVVEADKVVIDRRCSAKDLPKADLGDVVLKWLLVQLKLASRLHCDGISGITAIADDIAILLQPDVLHALNGSQASQNVIGNNSWPDASPQNFFARRTRIAIIDQ